MNSGCDFVVVSDIDGDVKEMNGVSGLFESEFDGVVDMVHEMHKSGEFCSGSSEYKKYVVDETFPYENVVAPFLVDDFFDSAHEYVSIWWSISTTHRCACVLYVMVVLESEMF